MSSPVVSVSVIGFFSLLLLLTLNADNGRDVLDALVPWIDAQTELTQSWKEDIDESE